MPKAQISSDQVEATRQALRKIPPRPVIDSPTAQRVAENFADIYRARRNGVGWEELITKYFHRVEQRPSLRSMLRIFRALCEERELPYQMERSPRMRDRKIEREVKAVLSRHYDRVHRTHEVEGHTWATVVRELFPREEMQPATTLVARVWAELKAQRKKKR